MESDNHDLFKLLWTVAVAVVVVVYMLGPLLFALIAVAYLFATALVSVAEIKAKAFLKAVEINKLPPTEKP